MGLGGFFRAIGRGVGAFERAAQNAQLQYRGWTPEVIDAAQRQRNASASSPDDGDVAECFCSMNDWSTIKLQVDT